MTPLIHAHAADRQDRFAPFRCDGARLHTLPGAPAERVATHEQIVAHRQKLKTLNTNQIVPRFGVEPDDEAGFFESACYAVIEYEDRYRQCGLVWSWIDERPAYVSAVAWDNFVAPKRPGRQRFRLSLLGGGQIRVSEDYVPLSGRDAPGLNDIFICYQPRLRVTADAGDGLRHYTGILENFHYEMGANAAQFLPGTPQSVVDRVAQTFRLLTSNPNPDGSVPYLDNFMALLDRTEQCSVCARPLRDHVSTLLGVGPDCARQMKLPHSLEAANRIVQRRKQLLGEVTTNDADINQKD